MVSYINSRLVEAHLNKFRIAGLYREMLSKKNLDLRQTPQEQLRRRRYIHLPRVAAIAATRG